MIDFYPWDWPTDEIETKKTVPTKEEMIEADIRELFLRVKELNERLEKLEGKA